MSKTSTKKHQPFVQAFTPIAAAGEAFPCPKKESGTALIELAIVVNVIFLFVMGAITYSEVFRQVNLTHDALRHAARSAGALAFDYPAYCNDAAVSVDCAAAKTSPDTLPEAAVAIACQYLNTTNYRPEDFLVSAQIYESNEADFSGRLIRMSITKNVDDMIGREFYGQPTVSSNLVFMLEKLCTP